MVEFKIVCLRTQRICLRVWKFGFK
jgi:hypothetical protein